LIEVEAKHFGGGRRACRIGHLRAGGWAGSVGTGRGSAGERQSELWNQREQGL